jgi:hypothetical protein
LIFHGWKQRLRFPLARQAEADLCKSINAAFPMTRQVRSHTLRRTRRTYTSSDYMQNNALKYAKKWMSCVFTGRRFAYGGFFLEKIPVFSTPIQKIASPNVRIATQWRCVCFQ